MRLAIVLILTMLGSVGHCEEMSIAFSDPTAGDDGDMIQALEIVDGEIEMVSKGVSIKRRVTPEEAEQVKAAIQHELNDMKLTEQPAVQGRAVEVEVEFETDDRKLEIKRQYSADDLPKRLADLRRQLLSDDAIKQQLQQQLGSAR